MKSKPKDLCDVVKEITAALVDEDWARYQSNDRYYYVIRDRDFAAELDGDQADQALMNGFSLPKPEAETFWDWYIRAALAEEPADRLAGARKRLAADGVDSRLFDEALEAVLQADSADAWRVLEHWLDRFLTKDRFDACFALIEAVRIEGVRQGHLFISEADRPELRRAVEVRFLKELAERYPKAVKRATSFDWLSFSDPQLREASRCYLYGFFRAAVLIAVAALESRLRAACLGDRNTTYSALADLAFGKAGVIRPDPANADALKDAFELRNAIAHASAQPTQRDAERVLLLVRGALEELSKNRLYGD